MMINLLDFLTIKSYDYVSILVGWSSYHPPSFINGHTRYYFERTDLNEPEYQS